jgi:hypothetical protein
MSGQENPSKLRIHEFRHRGITYEVCPAALSLRDPYVSAVALIGGFVVAFEKRRRWIKGGKAALP